METQKQKNRKDLFHELDLDYEIYMKKVEDEQRRLEAQQWKKRQDDLDQAFRDKMMEYYK